MVVCKYFLQGNCRYGNTCWYEHPSGGNQGYSVSAQRQLFGGGKGGGGGFGQKVSFRDSFGQNQNPYKWLSQDVQQQKSPASAVVGQPLSSADLIKSLSAEIAVTWEGGNIWPFTCIAFEKEMPNVPGFDDMSPEEMRLEAYEALKAGNVQEYVQKVEGALNQVVAQRQELKNPNVTLKQKLISFIDDCKRKKSSGSGGHVSLFSESGSGGGLFGSSSSGEGLFGSGSNSGLFGQSAGSGFSQTGGQSLFGQSSSQTGLFGQSSQQTGFGTQSTSGQTGLFGQNSAQSTFGQTGSQSLFGHGAFVQKEPSFGQTSFGTAQSSNEQHTVFGQPLPQTGQNIQTIFGQPAPQTGLFGKDPAQTPKTGLFGKPDSSAFSGASFSTPQSTGVVSGNIFQTSTPFGQSGTPATSLFGKPENSFSPVSAQGQTTGQPSGETTSVYTPMDKLTAEEIDQFRAPTFTLGSIPTKPPPKELCF